MGTADGDSGWGQRMVPGQGMGDRWGSQFVHGPVDVCVVGKYRPAGGVVDGGYWLSAGGNSGDAGDG
jgi:hypothetical protein